MTDQQRLSPPGTPAQRSSLRVAVWVFLLSVGFMATLIWNKNKHEASMARASAINLAQDHALAIESRIDRLMSSTYLIAATLRKDQGKVMEFEATANEILPLFPGVAALSLSPGGVIEHVVPLANNARSLGFNQLADPVQSPEAFLARDTGKLTLAGPLELAQGGTGAVGRLPIFLPDAQNNQKFWGFVNVVIRFPQALEATGLQSLRDLGFEYELWRHLPNDHNRQIIASSYLSETTVTLNDPVSVPVTVPNGVWMLSLSPRQGWSNPSLFGAYALAGLVFSAMLAYLVKLLVDQHHHRNHLEELVERRTHEIQSVQNHLQATLDAIPDLMFEIDLSGKLHRAHALNEDLLAVPSTHIQQRHIEEMLPADVCQVAYRAMQETLQLGRSHGQQYHLSTPAGERWFELSVAHKTNLASDTPHFVFLARDITERKNAEAEIQLAAKVFEQSSEAFLITDAQQRIVKVNPAFTEITGYTPDEVLGKTPKLLTSGRQGAKFYQRMWGEIQQNGHWQGEIWNRRKDGHDYPEWLSITRVADASGETKHFIAIFSDTTQRKAQEAKIRTLAYFDPLTGLANRTLLKDRIEHDLGQAKRHKTPLALLFLDLDHFKNINDSLGHAVGDELLVEVGRRLTGHLRAQDTLARLGGDEFVAVLPDTDANGVTHLAQSLLDLLAQPYSLTDHELNVTPSIGIALCPEDGQDFETLYRCADTAMYRAKQDGRNCFRFFTHELQSSSIRRLTLENALRRALERNQLYLHYQPQQCLRTQRVLGVEVLLRWQHPELGSVSPAEFIPIAESSGLILPIGEWVLRSAAEQVKTWIDSGLPEMMLAVNLSAVQFRQPQLLRTVTGILNETGLPAHCLELELTESVAMHDPLGAIATMDALHQQGIRMSVDDFGTGYSSLNYLKRFKVYKLKIDQSFVRDVPGDPEDALIVGAIINMAHSLGLTTIAEGVETAEQQQFLKDKGCDEIQGYLFSRPLPPQELERLLRQGIQA